MTGDDIKPNPGSMRSLLLSMEGAVHGRIPDILGHDETERVDTMVRFLNGTTEAEMSEAHGSAPARHHPSLHRRLTLPPTPRAAASDESA